MSASPADAMNYLDEEAALARVRGNEALFKRMLGLFLKSTEFSAFEDALAEEDYHKAADLAHAIKGMTGNLALNAVCDTSTDLMNQLRTGQGPTPDTLSAYRDALEKTQALVTERLTDE